MNNKFPNRGSFQSFGLFLSKKEEARGSRRYGQPAKLLAAAGGPARPIHPSTYQSRAQLLAHDRPMPQSSSPLVGPTLARLEPAHAPSPPPAYGPRRTGSTAPRHLFFLLHSSSSRGSSSSFRPYKPTAPPDPLAGSAPPRGSPAAAACAGDLFYESRERLRLRDGRCAVLGCGFCPVRCGELLRAGGPETGERSGTFFKRE